MMHMHICTYMCICIHAYANKIHKKKKTSRCRPAGGIMLELVSGDFFCALFGNIFKLLLRYHSLVVVWLFFFCLGTLCVCVCVCVYVCVCVQTHTQCLHHIHGVCKDTVFVNTPSVQTHKHTFKVKDMSAGIAGTQFRSFRTPPQSVPKPENLNPKPKT